MISLEIRLAFELAATNHVLAWNIAGSQNFLAQRNHNIS